MRFCGCHGFLPIWVCHKLRITGGEPLLRVGLPDLIGDLNRIDGVDDVALTTNGVLLAQHAAALKAARPESRDGQPGFAGRCCIPVDEVAAAAARNACWAAYSRPGRRVCNQ